MTVLFPSRLSILLLVLLGFALATEAEDQSVTNVTYKIRPNVIHEFAVPLTAAAKVGVATSKNQAVEMAKAAIDLGFYISLSGILTFKNGGELRETAKKLPLDRIVVETDAPYLTPVPYRGKRNESSYIKLIADKLAEIKKVSVEEVAAITTANAEKIFGC